MSFRRRDTGATLREIEDAYRRRFAEFVRVAAAVVGDDEAALDAVQDAFAEALRKRRHYRREGSLDGWLWRAVLNHARNSRRRADRRHAPFVLGEPPAWNGQPAGDVELRATIAALPERQRLVLFLRYFGDLDYRAIASALAISEGTVAATLNAAHRALRRSHTEVLHE